MTLKAYKGDGPQAGATLLVTLLMLALIMILGVAAMNSSQIQSWLAANLQFEDMAMNKAEASVQAGEAWLASGANYKSSGFDVFDSGATPQLHPIGDLKDDTAPLAMTWSNSNSAVVNGDATQRYIIELIAKDQHLSGSDVSMGGRGSTGCNTVNLYQITGRGQATRGAVKFIQSFYSVLTC